ncbi:FG-GAP-like repeat-containing protein [Pantanalinema sp. GBBB05]|uniref:FG-GAP-like repeat-containing protein n=1 Tax=Pantanalinema sp. GBBB05 TaxID=2604139 RepID=UPI001DE7F964|nr:hypothetical protein [Pantanalinema sp. GBBB05]
MDTFQDFNSPLTTTSSNFLPNQSIQDPLTSLGSFNGRASAAYSDPSIDFLAQSSQVATTAAMPVWWMGQRSETWQQGAGGLPGTAENGFKFSGGQGVTAYQRGDEFGKAVATGDFNGDGYVDLAIGTPGEDSSAYNDDSGKPYDEYQYNGPGQITIIYGSVTGLSATNSQTFQAGETNAFGRSLAVGDFNNDGKADLAVGSGNGIGIFNGSSIGLQRGISLGAGSYALTTGDFNGDGADDLAAGNPFYDNEKGSVSIFLGQTNVGLTNAASQFWTQDSPGILGLAESAPNPLFNSEKTWGDRFGFSLTAGDFNGDGRDDLAIGAPGERFYMGGISNVPGGAVNVLYGSGFGLMSYGNQFWDQNGTEGSQFNLEGGIEANDQFGYAVKAGDFNGDGVADLAIGVPGEDTSTGGISYDSNGGAVAIIYGKRFQGLTNEGNQLIDQNTPGVTGGIEEDDRFGQALAVGDFDHNGFDDLVIGTPGETAAGKRGGSISIMMGTANGIYPLANQLIDQSQITGAQLEDADLFGAALATGDFDGNGSDDIAIGAPGEKIGNSFYSNLNHAGEVNVVYGNTFLRTITVTSDLTPIREGSPVSAAFFVNDGGFGVPAGTLVKLRSIGTAKLGVDFTVSGATVEGDYVIFRMPGPNSDPTTRMFTVSALQDNDLDPVEQVVFEVVKGDGYMVQPNQKASVLVLDPSPLVVDTLVDENDGDYSPGDLSLRESVQLAGRGSTISFASGLQGTITLNSQLLINKNLTIDGPGANLLSLSGNNTSRVFEIANGATVTLEGLTIANGFANNASGGAIENYGTLMVDNSRVTNNRAVYGGGIHNVGNLTLQNSTVDNNTASYDGGGVYVDMGTVNIYNSTISGNRAEYGAGIYRMGGDLVLNHATITNNTANLAGSGLYNYPDLGTTTAKNTLIAGNRTLYNAGGDVYGHVSSLGWNLVGDASGSTGWIYYYDRWGTNTSVIDPKLGALQNNGGTTPTHALLSGSPAIDASSADDLLFEDMAPDQRGITIQNGRRDIGAVEFTATDGLQLGLGIATNPQPNPQPNLLAGFLSWLELNFPRF